MRSGCGSPRPPFRRIDKYCSPAQGLATPRHPTAARSTLAGDRFARPRRVSLHLATLPRHARPSRARSDAEEQAIAEVPLEIGGEDLLRRRVDVVRHAL